MFSNNCFATCKSVLQCLNHSATSSSISIQHNPLRKNFTLNSGKRFPAFKIRKVFYKNTHRFFAGLFVKSVVNTFRNESSPLAAVRHNYIEIIIAVGVGRTIGVRPEQIYLYPLRRYRFHDNVLNIFDFNAFNQGLHLLPKTKLTQKNLSQFCWQGTVKKMPASRA